MSKNHPFRMSSTNSRWPLSGLLFIFLLSGLLPHHKASAQKKDEFLTALYDQLHASPMQEKFRKLAPMPIGAVYVQRPGEGEKEIREHFSTMKKLGFNSLKQIMVVPGWTIEQVSLLALEEGIIPWWYGEGGWEPITDDLLRKLKIAVKTPLEQVRVHPKMQAYQNQVMRERVLKTMEYIKTSPTGRPLRDASVAFHPEVGGRGFDLTDEGKALFVDWAKKQYQTLDKLNHAYNRHHMMSGPSFSSWDEFSKSWERLGGNEYRHLRDILRFKADHSLASIEKSVQEFNKFYGHAPFRGGGELGLFLPAAWYGVDLEGIAGKMTEYGSFYPSIHFAWHYNQVDHELVRPFYMQASLANDYFKGGWAASWEATGGPQQFSGGKSGNGFTVDEGTMTQFLLSHLAGGFKGWGLWAWSTRTAGWEAGEYSLLDRHNKVTPRAIKVGQIGQAAQKYRDELWQGRKEPLVGVLVDWDNDAIWAAMSVAGREGFKQKPIDARVGVSRALINGNVPFEYVTPTDIRKGLAPRYKVIYLPSILALNQDLLERLSGYVQQGGRLVLDMPSAWYDENAALLSTDKGTTFEKTFGTIINEYQYAGVNKHYHLDQLLLQGFIADLTTTTAKATASFDNGKPAVTEHAFGKGTAVILGVEASGMTFKPGNDPAEKLLLRYTLGALQSPYTVQDAIAYRLAAPQADHYFLLNDGPPKTVTLDTRSYRYKTVTDAVTGEKLKLGEAIYLEGDSGRWLRFEK
jgi:beta-galactosidase